MYLGAHVSAAGNVGLAPARAAAWGCEVMQIFSRPPQGGPAPKITTELAASFRKAMKENNIRAAYIHSPYFINFASPLPRIANGSSAIIREELERASLLGCVGVVTHLGSAKAVGEAAGVAMTIAGIKKLLTGYTGTAQLLLELSAGSGATIGDTFEELRDIIHAVEAAHPTLRLGVCLDTQHAFASGYDVRTTAGITKTLRLCAATIGKGRIKLLHLNDSKTDFASHVDRHENIGQGKLGRLAFAALLKTPSLRTIPGVLETPRDEKGTEVIRELKLLKKMRDSA
ncbi:MAG: deoxyribonuclease IV [Patescibacteria group bacterium]